MKVNLLHIQNKYFTNLFLTLTFLVIILIVSMSFIFYISYENITLGIIQSADRDSLLQVSYSVNYMIDTAKTLLNQVYMDTTINSLFFTDPDAKEIISALGRLTSYSATTPFIHSIFVYSGLNHNFYSNYSSILVQTRAEFFDRQLPELLENTPPEKRLRPIPRKVPEIYYPNDDNQYSNVYTFIFTDQCSNASEADNAVILNISETWMRNIIEALDPNREGDIFIVDSKGTIVNSGKNQKMFGDISREKYFARLLKAGRRPGYFIDSVNGRKVLVTFVPSSYTDWTFIRMTPYDSILQRISRLKLITGLSCLIILVLGFVAAYFSSHKLYKPYDNIQSKLNSIEAETRNTRIHLKEEFLKKLLSEKSCFSPDSLETELKKKETALSPYSPLILALLKIDRYADFINHNDQHGRSLLRFAVMNIASELAAKRFVCETVDLGGDSMVLLLSRTAPGGEENRAALDELAGQIKVSVQEYLNLSLSVFFSSQGNTMEAGFLYDEVLSASQYRLFLGHGCTAFYGEIKEGFPDRNNYPQEKECALIDAIKLGKLEESKRLYAEVIREISGSSFNEFNTSLLRITLALDTALEQMLRNAGISIAMRFSSFIIELKEFEMLDELVAGFQKKLEEVLGALEEHKNGKHDRLAVHIMEIIHARYADPGLTIEAIADSVNMSKDYVNRIFKKYSSKSIHDYILEVRINSAKALLLKSDRNIQEIAARTGFYNTAYFSTLFKKYHGITPNEFRQKIL